MRCIAFVLADYTVVGIVCRSPEMFVHTSQHMKNVAQHTMVEQTYRYMRIHYHC